MTVYLNYLSKFEFKRAPKIRSNYIFIQIICSAPSLILIDTWNYLVDIQYCPHSALRDRLHCASVTFSDSTLYVTAIVKK